MINDEERSEFCWSRSRPFISVIIIAYNRKKYILNAIKSVIDQTLSKDKYEIIVIKNFKDDIIDNFIERNDIKNILSNKVSLGEKISEALNYADGAIISFLEDDDLFLNNKLQMVYNSFNADESLVFLRNNVAFIDDAGNQISDPTPRHRKYISKKQTIKCAKCNVNDFIKFYKSDSYFNLSSMSIRKNAYCKFLEDTRNIVLGMDFLIFYLGFFIDKTMLTINNKLTLYRITNSQFSNSPNLIGYKLSIGAFVYITRLINNKSSYLYKSAFMTIEFMKLYLLDEINIKTRKYYIIIFNKIIKSHGLLLFIRMHPAFGIYSVYKLILKVI